MSHIGLAGFAGRKLSPGKIGERHRRVKTASSATETSNKAMCVRVKVQAFSRSVTQCAYAYPPSSSSWKNTRHVFHTAGVPPNHGSSCLPTINCTWNSRKALRKIVSANDRLLVATTEFVASLGTAASATLIFQKNLFLQMSKMLAWSPNVLVSEHKREFPKRCTRAALRARANLEKPQQFRRDHLWLIQWNEVSRVDRDASPLRDQRGGAQRESFWHGCVARTLKDERRDQ